MVNFEDFAIVTVRNSSSRLPNKAIMKIKNELRSIDIVIKRAKKTQFPVVLCSSTDKSDDIFEKVAKEHEIEIFRGALLNKIKRWHDCFQKFSIQNALLLDGDDLCHNYDLGRRSLKELKSKNVDMISHSPDIVTGFFTYAINKNGISKLYNVARDENINTDVITKFIEKAQLTQSFATLEDYERNENIRLTLDYKEDLEFFRKLYENIDILSSGKQVIDFLSKNRQIIQINFHRQKDFLENQKKFNEEIM